jgi:chemotaxis protein CheX
MDVRFINPFIGAIKNVFHTMLATEILISKPRLKEPDEHFADVTAIIGFSGEATGSVAICFPIKTGVNAASKFADAQITQTDPEFADALGELANMVAGQAKSKLEGFNISISLPRVVSGQGLQLLNSKTTPVLVLPCDSSLGRFSTEVTMVLTKKAAASQAPAAAPASAAAPVPTR